MHEGSSRRPIDGPRSSSSCGPAPNPHGGREAEGRANPSLSASRRVFAPSVRFSRFRLLDSLTYLCASRLKPKGSFVRVGQGAQRLGARAQQEILLSLVF
jgi:hypothetical protein